VLCSKAPETVILRRPDGIGRTKDFFICLISQTPRFFAEFSLSEMPRSFASLRMTSEGLRMNYSSVGGSEKQNRGEM
jgi:hypothetical protein